MKPLKQPELYKKLIDAYSDENLYFITRELIELYQEKRFSIFSGIANKLSDFIIIDEDKDALCFSRLIVLCHHDKGLATKNMIKYSFGNTDNYILMHITPQNIKAYKIHFQENNNYKVFERKLDNFTIITD